MCFIENKNVYTGRPSAYEPYTLKIDDLLKELLLGKLKELNKLYVLAQRIIALIE